MGAFSVIVKTDSGNVGVLAWPHNPRNLVQADTRLTRHPTVAGIRTSNCIMIRSEINRCLQLPDRRHHRTRRRRHCLFSIINLVDAVGCQYLSRYTKEDSTHITQKNWEADGISQHREFSKAFSALVLSRI